MFVVFVLVAAAVLFAVVVVALGRGDLLDSNDSPVTEVSLPDDELRPVDLEELRFTIAQRGYRMDQVDAVLDRLERELAQRDRRIAELEARLPGKAAPRSPASELPRRRPGRTAADPGR